MSKSVYSLVLIDELVEKVDRENKIIEKIIWKRIICINIQIHARSIYCIQFTNKYNKCNNSSNIHFFVHSSKSSKEKAQSKVHPLR